MGMSNTGRVRLGAALAFMALTAAGQGSERIATRCAELFSLTEKVEKVTDTRTALGEELDRTYWKTLSPNYTHAQYNAMARIVNGRAERTALSTSGAGTDSRSLEALFDRARSIMRDAIRNDQSLPQSTKDSKLYELDKVRLILSSDEFVSVQLAAYKAESPNSEITEEGMVFGIYGRLRESCGRNGLSRNAFHLDGIDAVVVCPGLLMGLQDFGGSDADQAAALMFTLGHELGHAIDQPFFGYLMMGYCYSQITGYASIWDLKLANEIIADHWGAVVLAEVLRTRPGGPPPADEIVKVIAYASDGWDEPDTDDREVEHPPTIFRVNQTIGRNPAMNDLLSCPLAGEPNPTCTMAGKIPS